MFFEGSEKKVEIIVDDDCQSLRTHKDKWEGVVKLANAAILSSISNQRCDAYLLSESSLFVYDHRVVMITCGTTTLIDAIEEILTFVPIERVGLLMYERKNEHHPDQQLSCFEDDVARLSKWVDGEERRLGGFRGNHVFLYHYCREGFAAEPEDTTLEILMHELTPQAPNIFKAGKDKATLEQETGLRTVFEGFETDDWLFDPVGYSLNSIGENQYYTIHVTPERGFSYASFETNYRFSRIPGSLENTVNKVLSAFKPASFALVLFEKNNLKLCEPEGYEVVKELTTTTCGYRVHFRDFRKKA